jgi:hypothetical protein
MDKGSSVSNSSARTNAPGKFFLRNATGLRREVSMLDAFIMNTLTRKPLTICFSR